jgi:hypothetical protein
MTVCSVIVGRFAVSVFKVTEMGSCGCCNDSQDRFEGRKDCGEVELWKVKRGWRLYQANRNCVCLR